MPPLAEVHTDAGLESEEVEKEDDEGAKSESEDGVGTDDGEGAGSESGDGAGTDDGEGVGSESEELEGDGEGAKEGHGDAGARVPAAVPAPAARNGGVGAGRPAACCCVCMEPWTCYSAHRICCIPCGHVYGRSCLERWLQHCGNKSAKVVEAQIARAKAQFAEENHKFREKLCSKLDDLYCKQAAALRSEFDKHIAALLSDVQQVYQKQLDRDVGAMVKTFVSMKEQMKKMAEQNATPMDLIEFMDQSYTQLFVLRRLPADGACEDLSA